jgi:diguanylate cyclase (GGDEF)-like protein
MGKTRVLVVEDKNIVAMEIRERLLRLGYEVVGVAAYGEDTAKMAEELKPDVVLMDIKLRGDMDGIEAAGMIRAGLGIPVIFLTAYPNEDFLRRAKDIDPSGYILKPFHEAELVSTIEIALRRQCVEGGLKEMSLNLKNINEKFALELADANEQLRQRIVELNEREKLIERNYQIQKVISGVLRASMEPLSLDEQLERTLDMILALSWLSFQKKGSIFTVDEESETLVMKAHRELGRDLLKKCARVPFGHCLCGRAAAERRTVFADRLDHRHDNRFKGMTEHGHFCVPIVSGQKTLGVINMYVREGHVRIESEEEFLTSIADALAGIIERRTVRKKLETLALYDSLTGLSNRTMFFDRMEQALAIAERAGGEPALLYLDLDGFKNINDTLGHDAGDLLLKEVSGRLLGCVRKSDTVARMGGDEFTVILTQVGAMDDAARVAEKIIESLAEPFYIKGNNCAVGASIGISLFPADGADAGTLLKNADVAMYHAKESGKNTYKFFVTRLCGFDSLVKRLSDFVERQNGRWDHLQWLELLYDLKKGGFEFDDEMKHRVGSFIEALKGLYPLLPAINGCIAAISAEAGHLINSAPPGKTWDNDQREDFISVVNAKGVADDTLMESLDEVLESGRRLHMALGLPDTLPG